MISLGPRAQVHTVITQTHNVEISAKRTYHPHVIHRVSVDNPVATSGA